MIKHVCDLYNTEYCKETNRKIDMLNNSFFSGVNLTSQEEETLAWLCGWNEEVVCNIISAFKKIVV